MKKELLLLAGISIVLASCQSKSTPKEVHNYTLEGETIVIPENSNIRSKIKTAVAVKEPYNLQIFSAAKVTAIPNKYAEIAAPFNGRIMQSFVKLGQKVSKGTPLFSINSSDYADAQKLYQQAKQQFQLADKDLKRQKDLLAHGVGVQRDVEASKTAYEVAKTEFAKAGASIKIFGVEPEKMLFGEPLIIRSPIDGEVITNKLVVGKYLVNNSDAILTVAELSTVWITGTVKEKDIRFIHEGDIADAEVTAYPSEIFHGKVFHIDQTVEEETHSINVLIACANADRKLKPGMYASVKFTDKPTEVIHIPATALLQFNDQNFVFVQTSAGKYKKRSVKTGETTKGKTIIVEGLNEGETVIAEGGFYLQEAK